MSSVLLMGRHLPPTVTTSRRRFMPASAAPQQRSKGCKKGGLGEVSSPESHVNLVSAFFEGPLRVADLTRQMAWCVARYLGGACNELDVERGPCSADGGHDDCQLEREMLAAGRCARKRAAALVLCGCQRTPHCGPLWRESVRNNGGADGSAWQLVLFLASNRAPGAQAALSSRHYLWERRDPATHPPSLHLPHRFPCPPPPDTLNVRHPPASPPRAASFPQQ